MSIKIKDISTRKSETKKSYVIESKLVLVNTMEISKKSVIALKREVFEAKIEMAKDALESSIIHHVYGDLVEHVNELAILAQHHITGANDADEVDELKTKIRNIIKGI